MLERQKNFLKRFAVLSPVIASQRDAARAVCAAIAAAVLLACWDLPARAAKAAGPTATVKRQAAEAQFAKAEEQRAALNAKAPEKRTLAEYKQVAASYRRVYLITPHSSDVPEAFFAAAEIYTEMGDRFGKSYYQSAVDSYQFLVHEYPRSRYNEEALLRIAKLQRDQLGDPALATKSYETFLKKHPRSKHRREAQEALAELALLRGSEAAESAANPAPAPRAPAPKEKSEEATDNAPAATAHAVSGGATAASGIPRLRRITTSGTGDATRVTIDLEDDVQYTSARIGNPDRIFFDLHAARLTPELAKENIAVEGSLLSAVRVAQNHSGVVRVVLDISGVKDYSASLLHNPPRLVIDLYGSTKAMRAEAPKRGKTPAAAEKEESAANTKSASTENAIARSSEPTPAKSAEAAAEKPAEKKTSAITASAESGDPAPSPKSSLPLAKNVRGRKGSAAKPDLIKPTNTAQPTRDGQSTLTRALGLKIGRIVIDPGHGGHDTGTIGPTGLMEKDLCLDVALRLGKIIRQRLPGAEVVFTRDDDTFIPLEERTHIANQAKADLFLSIHANSSHDHVARGIETYYLNLKGSAEAMEVAARENATAEQSVHDLENLVKQIARTEKIDESRELAEDIQDSLAKRIVKTTKAVKNRGVRKAPFVVLIGADMPSILTEISFLSNPADEQLLKKPEYRERVAEGLYQGVASYLQSLNSVAVNLSNKPSPGRRPAVTAVEQSRNEN